MVYMPHWPKPLGSRPSDFSLNRIKSLLERLGNPEKRIPPVIHVGGTNGKGSTIAFIKAILCDAGFKTHVYTSPHLVNFNERIVISGNMISDSYLYEVLEECRIAAPDINLTFFEATTIAAIIAFANSKADFTLVEVGMGGRLDATNVVNPILTIITSVALDHTEFLGNSIEQIAAEKAGIIKPNVTCVVAPNDVSVMKTIEGYAIVNKSCLYRGGLEWHCSKQGQQIKFESRDNETLNFPLPNLLGDHQIINAGNAIAACSILAGKFNYDIYYENIANGLRTAYWPCRLECIKKGHLADMLPNNWQLFIDGAHNAAGSEAISTWVKQNYINYDVYLICGMTKNRNVCEFLKFLQPYIKLVCGIGVKSEPNSLTALEVMNSAISLGIEANVSISIKDAISKIMGLHQGIRPVMILICGSLFLFRDLEIENNL